jgi:hypothetical protein
MSFANPKSLRAVTFSCFALVLLACGGRQKEPETAPEPEPTEPAAEEEMSMDEEALLAEIEASADAADAAAEGAEGEDGEREVVYRLSPDGLKVQINGAEFRPKAEAVKVNGRWGVKLTVEATTTQEKVLLSPKKGPLAFGGTVDRGSPSKFGDTREGGSDMTLSPGKPLTFSRTWPDADQKGLAPGEKLELHVGLWGLGTDAASRRPVNRFFVVKMVADRVGAQPLLQPPGQ